MHIYIYAHTHTYMYAHAQMYLNEGVHTVLKYKQQKSQVVYKKTKHNI